MKFPIVSHHLFPSALRRYQNRPLAEKKAEKIVKNFIRDYTSILPLTWEKIEAVGLIGELDSCIAIRLHFGKDLATVIITEVYVDENFNIIQCGTSCACLVY